tara:strand:- start:17602 stop:18126 length:525 start_codon:yes stop_codon:yes gene_type:complete
MASTFGIGLNIRRKIFVSYHHGGDRFYYERLIALFDDTYEVIQDNSVERSIQSNDTDYVIRAIRERYITGSSCTLVLCGKDTPQRKFVDWEIKATLDKSHGLIGVNLPSNPKTINGKYAVPDRLFDNLNSGYAFFATWAELTASHDSLRRHIELANGTSKSLIDNNRRLRSRNG